MTSPEATIWVKVMGAGTEGVTSVRCDPSVTTVDDLKRLVKTKYSPKLDHIAAPDLVVKGSDDKPIEVDTMISDRNDGRSKDGAFIVEVPQKSGSIFIFYIFNQF